MKNFNTHIFLNPKAVTVLLITHDWVSIKEASKYYNGLNLVRMERKNPKKFLLSLWKKPEYGVVFRPFGEKPYLEGLSSKKAQKIIEFIEGKSKLIRRKRYTKKINTNPLVQKYIKTFEEMSWVRKELIEKTFRRHSKKGKSHIYRKSDWRFKINLSKILIDYFIKFRGISLNKKEEYFLNFIFSIEPLSNYLVKDTIFPHYTRNLIDGGIPTIANFVEKTLFMFLYLATSFNYENAEEEFKLASLLLKALSKKENNEQIKEITDNLPPHSLCFATCYTLSRLSNVLFLKLANALDTHLLDVIRHNVSRNMLFPFP